MRRSYKIYCFPGFRGRGIFDKEAGHSFVK
jgi:hypothetical protein